MTFRDYSRSRIVSGGRNIFNTYHSMVAFPLMIQVPVDRVPYLIASKEERRRDVTNSRTEELVGRYARRNLEFCVLFAMTLTMACLLKQTTTLRFFYCSREP
jgi:hypothetical protein